jgi:hypothetical protein
MHKPRSNHTRRHRVIRDRRPNQQNISGKNGTHSSTKGARTALQEEKRIQERRHAMRANAICINLVFFNQTITFTLNRYPKTRPFSALEVAREA